MFDVVLSLLNVYRTTPQTSTLNDVTSNLPEKSSTSQLSLSPNKRPKHKRPHRLAPPSTDGSPRSLVVNLNSDP